jgi:hypothetical protein
MKRFSVIFILIALCSAGLFANPFIGSWKVEMVFVNFSLIFRFIDSEVYSIQEENSQEEEFLNYVLDKQTQSLDLGHVRGSDMKARYLFISDDLFYLYFHDELTRQMAEQMEISIPEDSNQITREFADRFVEGVKKVIADIPILIAKRIK